MRSFSAWPASLIASYASPPVSAPSPMSAMTLCVCPFRSRARASPSAAEIDVELCPVLNASYSLSLVFGKPESPPPAAEWKTSPCVRSEFYAHMTDAQRQIQFCRPAGQTRGAAQLSAPPRRGSRQGAPVFDTDSIKTAESVPQAHLILFYSFFSGPPVTARSKPISISHYTCFLFFLSRCRRCCARLPPCPTKGRFKSRQTAQS